MALTERLALLISLDSQGAVRGLESVGRAADRNLGRTESRIDRTAQRMQKAGTGMLAAAGLAATGLYQAGQAAADLEQAVGGTEAVFKDTSGAIDAFAKDAAKNFGLSERAAREATTSLGGQLKGLGFDIDEAADKAIELTSVAADLAATYGGTTAEAVAALGAAFRGEADPAERFNLFLNQNRVNAKAVELGLAATTSQVDANAKAQATLALITEQSADAQGQFAREVGTASGQMQIASAEFENAKAALGQSVAPILADVAGGLSRLAGGFSSANEASGGLLSQLAAFGTIGLGAAGALSFVGGKVLQFRDRLVGLGTAGSTAAALLGPAGLGLAIGKMADEAQRAATSVDALSRMTDEELADAALEAFEGYRALGKDGLEPFKNLAEASLPIAQRLRDELKRQGEDVSELDPILAAAAERTAELAAAGAAATPEVDGLAASHENLADASEEAQKAQDDLIGSVKDLFDEITSGVEAELDWHDAIDDLTSSIEENGRTLDWNTEQGRENVRSILDAKDALVGIIEQRIREGDTLDEAAAKGQQYVDGLKDQLREMGFTEEQIEEIVKDYGLIPTAVATTVKADTSQAHAAIAALISDFSNSVIDLKVQANLGAGRIFRAKGGPVYLADGGGPKGTDTVPAWLTPGEFVMQKSAVDRIGLGTLQALNDGLFDRSMASLRSSGVGSSSPTVGKAQQVDARTINITNNYPKPEPAIDGTQRALRKVALAVAS